VNEVVRVDVVSGDGTGCVDAERERALASGCFRTWSVAREDDPGCFTHETVIDAVRVDVVSGDHS